MLVPLLSLVGGRVDELQLRQYGYFGVVALNIDVDDVMNGFFNENVVKGILYGSENRSVETLILEMTAKNGEIAYEKEEDLVGKLVDLLNAGVSFLVIPSKWIMVLEDFREVVPNDHQKRILISYTYDVEDFRFPLFGGAVMNLQSADDLNFESVLKLVPEPKRQFRAIKIENKTVEEKLEVLVKQLHREQQPRKNDSPVHIFYPVEFLGPATFARCFAGLLESDRMDKLIPTIVSDQFDAAIGLVYSSTDSIIASIEQGFAVYFSRSRSKLWKKGEESGNVQVLIRIKFDCDADALKFTVIQLSSDMNISNAAFCHQNVYSCFDNFGNFGNLKNNSSLGGLFRLILDRRSEADKILEDCSANLENKSDAEKVKMSYTQRLFVSSKLLQSKLLEEAQELFEAVQDLKEHKDNALQKELINHVNSEASDLLYFALVAVASGKGDLHEVIRELDLRHLKVKRRPGNAKISRDQGAASILNNK